jgi:chemotaxis protein MotA
MVGMNIYSILGFIIANIVLLVGLRLASENLIIFLDYPSMFIVLGGTFAATAISFQLDRISIILKIFISHILGGRKIDFKNIIKNIAKVSEAYRAGEAADQLASKAEDFFLREAIQLIADGVLDSDKIIKILEDRVENMNYKRLEDAKKIKTLGRFPPAFGMMGTTIGMIVLLANLGGEDALLMIGPAMGVCLITTLYGVIVANLVFIPISENLIESCKETHVKNLIVLEGVKHILIKSNPVLLTEELNSFLLPSERMDWKEVI